jgi:nucleoside-triphosphatase
VNLIDLKEIGAKSILNSLEYCDVTICDEVGPMELFSPDFRRAVKSMIESNKKILCIIHKNMRDPVIVDLKSIPFAQLIEVTLDNRESLSESLAENIITQLEMKKRDE